MDNKKWDVLRHDVQSCTYEEAFAEGRLSIVI